jgi:DNA-binding response OmpR family regulator
VAKRILVVDDEQRIVDLLYKFLSKEGFEVLTSIDGESALKLAKTSVPDLIVLDVMMPGIDGGDVMASILEDEKLRYTPVIFLTGAVSEEEAIIRSEKGTGRLYMSKAGDIREQVKAIKGALAV